MRFLASVVLVVALAALARIPAPALGSGVALFATPKSALTGAPVALTLLLSAAGARAARVEAGSAVPIAFGDGAVGRIVLVVTRFGFGGRVFHAFARPGVYTASALSASVAITILRARAPSSAASTAAPIQTQAPAATSAPARAGNLLSAELRWPNGLQHLHLAAGSKVPRPVARLTLSAPGTIGVQWFLDGSPMSALHVNVPQGGTPVTFAYPAQLPPSGSHQIALRVATTMLPAVTYDFAVGISQTPTPAVAEYAALKFQGFLVQNIHFTKAAATYSGTGRANVAGTYFIVAFNGITVVPDGALSQLFHTSVGDVTAGIATATTGVNMTSTRFVGRGTQPPGPCASSNYHLARPGTAFNNQIGTFGRYGYTFSLMGVVLNPIGTQSIAMLCWAPAGVETASTTANDGFNTDALDFNRQYLLELNNLSIDEDGNFDTDVPGDTVGNYRFGYTPFTAQPTHAQTLHLRFGAGDGDPHAAFDNAPVQGPILQQLSPATTQGMTASCNWGASGINAAITINAGQTLFVGAPRGFTVSISQAILGVQNSAFLGGTMNGSFVAGQTVPTPPPQYVGVHGGAASAAAAFNSAQQGASGAHFTSGTKSRAPQFVVPGHSIGPNPSGQFGGSFTDVGDLVASTSNVRPYSSVRYIIAPQHGSLYVPGGQNGYLTAFQFMLFMEKLSHSPLWNQVPALDYSQPPQEVINGVSRFQSEIIAQFVGQIPQGNTGQGLVSGFSNGNLQHIFNGPASPVVATPAFPFPGLYVDRGSVTTPYGSTPAEFDASTKGQGFGFAFTDDGGNSGLFSLQGGVRSTYGSWSLDMQLYNVEIIDDDVAQSSFWGVVQIPAPIDAAVPVVVQQVDQNGGLGALFVPAGVTIGLHAWNASLHLNEPTTVGPSSIQLTDATLTLPNYSGSAPHVQGIVLSGGTLQNNQMVPLSSLASTRITGLDFTPLSFGFPDTGNTNVPVQLNGSGTIAGWTAATQILTLTATGNGFAPPQGYHFDVSQSVGVVDLSADIAYTGGGWDGSGQIVTANFVKAAFGLHVDDQNEKGQIGLNVSGGNGNSSSGPVTMANIKGAATFSRQNGSIESLAFGADLNLSSMQGHAVVLYDTSLTDPAVQSLGGTSKLADRDYDCSRMWCFEGDLSVQFDSQDQVSGEFDSAYSASGYAMYFKGEIKTQVDDIAAKGQFSFYNNGDWDMGVGVQGIPILIVDLDGEVCAWRHTHGTSGVCLDSGVVEAGWGFYFKGQANLPLGPFDGEDDAHVQYISGGGGFGTGIHQHGSIDLGVASVSADVDLHFITSPLSFTGAEAVGVCVVCVSVNGNIQITLSTSGYHVDSAGVSFGTCGVCGWL